MIGYILFVLLVIIVGGIIFYYINKVNIKDGYPRGQDRWWHLGSGWR